jgi:hypothetical protein
VTVDDAQRLLVVQDARPGDQLARARQREGRAEDRQRALILAPLGQDE